MASRERFQRYDSPDVLREAVRKMEAILSELTHRTARTTVRGAISGLKRSIRDLEFGKERTERLNKQRAAKDEKSKASATNAMQRWTDDGDQMVLNSALSDFEIGQALGKSRNAVATRRQRLLKRKQVIL